ncbi:30S ribosomal protein S8 [Candidatus Daviesbacteria bacterium]|nr:30S ribosomal protein S8 [Candidatus Daviesbacteria bacterium]
MDTVADALTRIKNGYMARRTEAVLTYSKLVLAVLKVLEKEGYIENFKEKKDEKNKNIIQILVGLKYDGKKPVLTDLKKISKPGLRVYKSSKKLPRVLNGLGVAIISTPKGVMTDRQARKVGLGGEILAYVW